MAEQPWGFLEPVGGGTANHLALTQQETYFGRNDFLAELGRTRARVEKLSGEVEAFQSEHSGDELRDCPAYRLLRRQQRKLDRLQLLCQQEAEQPKQERGRRSWRRRRDKWKQGRLAARQLQVQRRRRARRRGGRG